MAKETLIPSRGILLCEPLGEPEKTASGIYLPGDVKLGFMRWRVLAVGEPPKEVEAGDHLVGDIVYTALDRFCQVGRIGDRQIGFVPMMAVLASARPATAADKKGAA